MKEGVQIAHTPPESQFTVQTRKTTKETIEKSSQEPEKTKDSTPSHSKMSWPKDRVSVVLPKPVMTPKVAFSKPEVTQVIDPVDQDLLEEVLAMEEPSPTPTTKVDSTLPTPSHQKTQPNPSKVKSFQRRSLAEELLHKNPSWTQSQKVFPATPRRLDP